MRSLPFPIWLPLTEQRKTCTACWMWFGTIMLKFYQGDLQSTCSYKKDPRRLNPFPFPMFNFSCWPKSTGFIRIAQEHVKSLFWGGKIRCFKERDSISLEWHWHKLTFCAHMPPILWCCELGNGSYFKSRGQENQSRGLHIRNVLWITKAF